MEDMQNEEQRPPAPQKAQAALGKALIVLGNNRLIWSRLILG